MKYLMLSIALFGMMNINLSNFDYSKAWSEYDTAISEGRMVDAKSILNTIFSNAHNDKRVEDKLRSSISLANLSLSAEENGVMIANEMLLAQIDSSAAPYRNLVAYHYSIFLNQYLQNNYEAINARTETSTDGNLLTATKSFFTTEIDKAIQISLTDISKLNDKVEKFPHLIAMGDSTGKKVFSTIKYLLLENAVQHYQNGPFVESDAFFNTDPILLSGFVDFQKSIKKEGSLPKTLSLINLAINEAIADKNIDALSYFNLERLSYIYNHSNFELKDNTYIITLKTDAQYFNISPFAENYFVNAINIQKNTGKQEAALLTKSICEECIKLLGKDRSKICNVELQYITNPTLNLNMVTHYLPNKTIKAQITSKNLSKIYFKILQSSDYYLQPLFDQNKLKKYLTGCKVTKQWSQEIKMNSFYLEDKNNIEIASLPLGTYILVASNDASFNDAYVFAPLQITNLSYLEISPSQNGQYLVVDRNTGKPVQGAYVEFFQSNYDYNKVTNTRKKMFSAKSEKDGSVKWSGVKNTSFEIVVTKDKDKFESKVGHYINSYRHNPQAYDVAHIYTDRAIYRPGQTVYFKAILSRFSELGLPSLLPNKEITFNLLDANGQSLVTITKSTNSYGSCSESFVLPVGKLTGFYQIQSNYGSASFQVEEYKRPTFEVVFDTIMTPYKLGDRIGINGLAKTYAQANISNAIVTYRVTKSRIIPYCYRYYYIPENFSEELIASGKTTTDSDGKFAINFTAAKSINDKIDLIYNYNIYADIVDETGESQSSSYAFSLGNKSKLFSTDEVMKYDISNKINKTIFIKDFAGKILNDKGSLVLSKLKETPHLYEKDIFNNIYNNSFFQDTPHYLKLDSLQVESVVKKLNFTSNVPMDFGSIKPGIYRVELNLDSKEASPYKEYIVVTDIRGANLPKSSLLHYKLNKTKFAPNDELIVDLATAEKGLSTYYILSKNDNILKQGWIDVKRATQIKHQVTDQDQGNLTLSFAYVYNNRFYKENLTLDVPWVNKYFDIKIIELRDKSLPGSDQTVKVKLIPREKTNVMAEVLATMYDASLDQYVKHQFHTINFPTNYNQFNIEFFGFNVQSANQLNPQWGQIHQDYTPPIQLPRFIDLIQQSMLYFNHPSKVRATTILDGLPAPVQQRSADVRVETKSMKNEEAAASDATSNAAPSAPTQNNVSPAVRTNLKESVFFFPHLITDKDGYLEFSFKNNEALTKWRLMLLAHNTELTMNYAEALITTHKDVMIQANSPRFLRVGDELFFTARVSNLSDRTIDAVAAINFTNAESNAIVKLLDDDQAKKLKLYKSEVKTITWKLKANSTFPDLVKYTVSVESDNISDGETSILPILSNKVLITESLPMYIRGKQTKAYQFPTLLNPSIVQKLHKYVIEVSSNPIWYAIQSMPYVTASSSDLSITGIANKYYVNYLAKYITKTYPDIQKVYKVWQEKDREALKSKLSKNEELKYVSLDETPWVKEALDEALQAENIVLLLDQNNVNNSLSEIYKSLVHQQLPDGSFPWYPGGRYNYYTTKYVVSQLGNIYALDMMDDEPLNLALKSLNYLDNELTIHYKKLQEDTKKFGGSLEIYQPSIDLIHHLYTRSLFYQIPGYRNEAFNFYYKQAIKYWNKYDLYTQAQLGYSDFNFDKIIYKEIQNSILQRSFISDELGRYWNAGSGYNWNEMPIERHAMIMQFFNTINTSQDQLDEMKIWLLKNKQGNKWSNTNATAAAIKSLLLTNGNKHSDLANKQYISLMVGSLSLPGNADIQAGTSYYKKTWTPPAIELGLGNLSMINPNENIGWGSAYFQYFEDVDKVKQTSNTSPLKIKKALFIKETTNNGVNLIPLEKQKLKPGDILVSRLIIESDRNMEFIHVKDLRASGTEPVSKISQYKYSGSFGYYESIRDQATNYYIDFLPKGTHVFESSVKIVHKGSYSGGLATIQSFYAPEFSSKTEGNRIIVD